MKLKGTLVLLAGRQAQTLQPDSLAEVGASASHGSMMLCGLEEEGTLPQMTFPTQSCEVLYPCLNVRKPNSAAHRRKDLYQEMSVGGEGKAVFI